jgi:hypothetical protein
MWLERVAGQNTFLDNMMSTRPSSESCRPNKSYLWFVTLTVYRKLRLLCVYIVTYTGFACLIRQIFDLMTEFIGPLYSWLQQFNKSLCDTLSSSSDWTLHGNYSDFQLNFSQLPCTPSVLTLIWFWSVLHIVSRRTHNNTASVVRNACLLVHYQVMDVHYCRVLL